MNLYTINCQLTFAAEHRLASALLQLLPDPLPDIPDTTEDTDVIADYAPDWSAS